MTEHMQRIFTARLNDGTTRTISGPAIRCTIEGRHRYFVAHEPIDLPDCEFLLVISEVTTGLRVCNLRSATCCESTARRWMRERLKQMLADGLGPRIHSQIEARQPATEEPAQCK